MTPFLHDLTDAFLAVWPIVAVCVAIYVWACLFAWVMDRRAREFAIEFKAAAGGRAEVDGQVRR